MGSARAHLDRAESVDYLDGTLAAEKRAHLVRCESCRQQVEELREMILAATDVTVPEPSPLFWTHLSSRITRAVAAEPTTSGRRPVWWWTASHLATAVTTATVVLAVVVGLSSLRRPTAGPDDPNDTPAVAGERLGAITSPVEVGDGTPLRTGLQRNEDTMTGADDDAADWTLLIRMTDALSWPEADTDLWLVDRQAIDGWVEELSQAERRTLGALLEAEIAGTGL